MTSHSVPLKRLPTLSWGLALLLVVVLMVTFGHFHRQLQERSDAPLFRVVINGEALILDGEAHASLGQEFHALAGRLDRGLHSEMQPWFDARLDAAFLPLETTVSDYLDWYFSLRGSYLRLAMALGGDMDEWLEEQLNERLVERSGVAAALTELAHDFEERLGQVQQRRMQEIGSTLHARYADRQASGEAAPEATMFDFDLALERTFQGHGDEARWSAAGAGGLVGLATGRLLAKRLVAGTAMQGSRALAGRLVARLGGHAARSLGTGAVATAATAPTGPAALLAGTAATAVALAGFAGTEYALLKTEEWRYRDAMQAEIEAEIARAKAQANHALDAAISDRAQAVERALQQAIREAEDGAAVPQQYRIFGG